MAEGRRMEINVSPDMEGNYPDSVSSSPRSRETDSDYFGASSQRWDAVDQGGGSTGSSTRVRLMCSCGGKILPRPHDNQLAYVGGDTRILAVERSIRFASMISKLSNVWGSGVSFKYQLPNEDLDSLISVTNDEDLDNMMAEYDRLQKSGYKFSRLRLFVFTKPAEGSTSSLGSVLEESRREQWFVEALNNPPVNQGNSNRSDAGSVSEASAWVNHMPDFLFGLENSAVGTHTNGGVEEDRMPRPNSFDSDASASARIDSNRTGGRADAQIGTNPVPDQTERGNRNSNSSPGQEIGIPAPSKPNLQTEIDIPEMINQRAPPPPQQQLPPQVPLQEFQNLQLKQQQQEHQLKQQDHQLKQQDRQIKHQQQQQQQQQLEEEQQDSMQRTMEETLMSLPTRKIYPDPARAVNLSTPGQEVYMQQPSQPDYYRQDHQQQQPPPQPSQTEYYRQDQQQQQQPVTYWQMHDQGANSQYPVYLVPAGSNMMQTMTAVRPTPTPTPGYYNPAQRVTAAPSVYDAPGLVTTVRATVQRQPQQQQVGGVSEVAADPYREQQPPPPQQTVMPLQPPPVSKVPTMYGAPMQLPVAGDVRMMYRGAAPVNSMPLPHPDSYAYPPQHVVYDPNMAASRQMYYTQAVNPQYHPMGPSASDINAASTLDMSKAAAPEQVVKLARVSQPTS